MIRPLFTISDSRVGAHNTPFSALNKQEAEAMFYRAVNDPEKRSPMSQYPHDYDLWYVGEFDTNNGKINVLPTPEHVLKASDVSKPTQQ